MPFEQAGCSMSISDNRGGRVAAAVMSEEVELVENECWWESNRGNGE